MNTKTEDRIVAAIGAVIVGGCIALATSIIVPLSNLTADSGSEPGIVREFRGVGEAPESYPTPTPTPTPTVEPPVVVEPPPAPEPEPAPEPVRCPDGTVAGAVDAYGNESACQPLNDSGEQCVAYDDANNCTQWYKP